MWEDGDEESSYPIVNLHDERLIKLYLHQSIALRPTLADRTPRLPLPHAKQATTGSIRPSTGLQ